MAGMKPGHDENVFAFSVDAAAQMTWQTPRQFFITFVDAIFTTFIERPFTNIFDASARNAAIACVYRACHVD